MRRTTIRLTDDQYIALTHTGEPIAAQVRALLDTHFCIGSRTFDTPDGPVTVSQATMQEMREVSSRGKVAPMKALRDSLRVRTPDGNLTCPIGLRTSLDIVEQLWAEWGTRLPSYLEEPTPAPPCTAVTVTSEVNGDMLTFKVNGTPFSLSCARVAQLRDRAVDLSKTVSPGSVWIRTIKEFRSITGHGLREAKAVVEHLLDKWEQEGFTLRYAGVEKIAPTTDVR